MACRHRLSVFVVFALFCTVFAAGSLAADDIQPSFAQALAALKPPAKSVVVTVGAEQCLLPAGAAPPEPAATLPEVAAAFQRKLETFGAITAAAPMTMTRLNAHPVNPNILDGIAPQDAMKFLVASLTQTQWQRLTSEQGLGLPDLMSETQTGLFKAVLPRSLVVTPQVASAAPGQTRDLTSLLPLSCLRLRRRVEIMAPVLGSTTYLPADAAWESGQIRYKILPAGQDSSQPSLYGVPVKEEAANTPKSGDLDFGSPALQAAVPVAGVKTVGALVSRIAQACRLEIYADRRWENRSVLVIGTAPAAPAADLLRSVAFCLTGTYRRVGPAYALTDDTQGLGTRRAIWARFETQAASLRRQALAEAQSTQGAAHSQTELSPSPDSLAYSPAQQKEASKFYAESGFSSVTQTFRQLTPEQQAVVQAMPSVTTRRGRELVPDQSKSFIVQEVPTVDLVVPGLDGPVDPGLSTLLFDLFQPASQADAASDASAPRSTSPLPLAALMKPIGVRAVLAYPQTAAEVTTLVTTAKSLGFNQLWLPVSSASTPADRSYERLSQALRETKKSGIAVYAVVDLLTRTPASVPAGAADLSLLGQTSLQTQPVQVPQTQVSQAQVSQALAVSPFSAAVRQELWSSGQKLAALPGLAGQVWRATAGPGYNKEGTQDEGFTALGYTEAARLAFLRQAHVDPVDLFPSGNYEQAETSLPGFDDAPLEAEMLNRWSRLRSDADISLLTSLYPQAAGKAGAGGPLLLVQQRGDRPLFSWYGSWDSAKSPLPKFAAPPLSMTPEKLQARAQSKTTMIALPLRGPLSERSVLDQWSGPLQQIGASQSWTGFVVEMSLPIEH